MSALRKVVALVLGTALVVGLWIESPETIVRLMDANLAFIKWACALAPSPYGAMTESALRAGFQADKALVLAEGAWVVGGILRLLFGAPKRLRR